MKPIANSAAFNPLMISVALLLSASPVWAQIDTSQGTKESPMGAGMDHDNMQMQGGNAPLDARDPNAYSGGYTLTEGPYVLPGIPRLKLADEHRFWSVLGDRMEYDTDSDSVVFDVQGWYGTTYNRLVIKTEGAVADEQIEESQTELLWGRALNAYFDTQLGVSFDRYDEGVNREWLAFGVQGLAPYWFELDMTAYLGDHGRTALSVEVEYELLLTQRWVLQPRAELVLYGKDDTDNGLGSGLSEGSFGLRLRYEITRQFAPYIGVEWEGKFGNTADQARIDGDSRHETRYVAGLRFWF